MKVYVLVVESTGDYSTDALEVKVFANHEDAKEVFKEEVGRAISDARGHWVSEKYKFSFSIYEESDYLNNHIDVILLEKEVL